LADPLWLTINKAGWSFNNFCSLAVRGIAFIRCSFQQIVYLMPYFKYMPLIADCKAC
jgi:hypothetical protein